MTQRRKTTVPHRLGRLQTRGKMLGSRPWCTHFYACHPIHGGALNCHWTTAHRIQHDLQTWLPRTTTHSHHSLSNVHTNLTTDCIHLDSFIHIHYISSFTAPILYEEYVLFYIDFHQSFPSLLDSDNCPWFFILFLVSLTCSCLT